MRETMKARRTDGVALLLLSALVLVFFWKIALTNRILAGLDVFAYFYPYRDFVSDAWQAGHVPLWNPYLFMGAPLLANSQAGALYPLHWPLMWLSAPKQIAWSIVLHIWLAGAGTYLFVRSSRVLRGRATAAFVAATVFALGGFLGAQVEHVNQLNASVWLPWLLLCLEGSMSGGRRRWLALLAGALVVAMTFLAGHTQAAYIVFAGAAVYALFMGWNRSAGDQGVRHLPSLPRRPWAKGLKGNVWAQGLRPLGVLIGMGLIGALMSAGQLLPTLELSGLSVRSRGLPYEEAASFSLKPGLIFKAFLPPLAWPAPLSEFVAYVGLVGLALAALGAWTVLKRRGPERSIGQDSAPFANLGRAALVLALLGVALAFGAYNPVYYLLYKAVPGFDLFRAPARWLLLYSFGAALLAGIGAEVLSRHKRRTWAVVLLLGIELFLSGQRLAYNRPTTPAAYDSMRSAPAHLLASTSTAPFRFLSLSDIGYDPGDLKDLQAMYRSYLPDQAVYDLVVASKMKEVLAFDLPLGYRLFSVDGYDGGLLPTARFVSLERLFLPREQIWSDGRLRQQLHTIPSARLLSLLNVRYVITDKLQDAWVDDVYYDLEHTVELGKIALTDLPDTAATHLGVVSYLTGTTDLVDGTPVAQIVLTSTQGTVLTTTLRAGEHTAEGLYSAQPVAHRQARLAHQWRDNAQGNDYLAVLDLLAPTAGSPAGQAVRPERIAIRSLLPQAGPARVALRGLTLIDARTSTSRSISVDPAYRAVHSGDVKIYENLAVQPRAFVVYNARVIPDDEAALTTLRDPGFDPAGQVILEAGQPLSGEGGPAAVDLVRYEPERVELRASLGAAGYLVLADAFYPGWTVEVDGQPAPIQQADLYFRAVQLDAGSHQVTFQFRPATVRVGLRLAAAAWLAWGACTVTASLRVGRNRRKRV